jgi:FkbM family methyltransferase
LNRISKIYVNFIFKIFQFGINLFYKSGENSNTTNNYQQMLKMKQIVYTIFDFLTKKMQHEKYEFFKKIIFKELSFFIRPLILSDIVMTSPAWEPYVQNVFVLKKNDVIIDVGAHIGTYSIPIATQIGESGKILAFEPNPKNAMVLRKNIELNKLNNIIVFENAASSKNQVVKLTLSNDPMLSRITSSEDEKTVKIECIPLDSLIKKLELKKVDWLKIDAEGSEISVLEGSIEILEKFHPKIIIEVRKENEKKMFKILRNYEYNTSYLGGEYFFAE